MEMSQNCKIDLIEIFNLKVDENFQPDWREYGAQRGRRLCG